MNADDRCPVRQTAPAFQADLFGLAAPQDMPGGLRCLTDLLSAQEEAALAHELGTLPFKPYDFHGYQANRRVVAFGYRYDHTRGAVMEAPPVPAFLEFLRARIGEAFDRPSSAFQQVLINEYCPGAGIGWHRDKPQFAEVVGISLLAPCRLRFRLNSGKAWRRASLLLEPRSAYLLSGPSRTRWEHSIPPLERHRYSITFRTLAGEADQDALRDKRPLSGVSLL